MQLPATSKRVDGWFPPGPLVASCLLCPSGPFRAHDFFYDPSITILLLHFTRSENGQHGLMATLLTATKIRCTCSTITGSNIVGWNVVLPEAHDRIGDQQLGGPGPGPNSEHACF